MCNFWRIRPRNFDDIQNVTNANKLFWIGKLNTGQVEIMTYLFWSEHKLLSYQKCTVWQSNFSNMEIVGYIYNMVMLLVFLIKWRNKPSSHSVNFNFNEKDKKCLLCSLLSSFVHKKKINLLGFFMLKVLGRDLEGSLDHLPKLL